MSVRPILLLGNPSLYEVSPAVRREELPALRDIVADLHDTMMDFRARHGAGRAIAAPQIGVQWRVIYMHLDEPVVIINPALADRSAEMFTVWDDCMSFPGLLVRVRRHRAITLYYRDLDWQEQELRAEGDISQLLQHEYDHLNGILATSRAIDGRSLALRSERSLLVGGQFFPE